MVLHINAIKQSSFNFIVTLENFFESSPFLSPGGEIYGLVHIGRQPERNIRGKKKNLKIQWEKKGHDQIFYLISNCKRNFSRQKHSRNTFVKQRMGPPIFHFLMVRLQFHELINS